MKLSSKTVSLFGVGLALALSSGTTQVRAGDQDFVLVNKTGYDIDEVYVAPANQDSWGDDVMEEDTLDNGEKVTIQFSRKEKECLWDLKVVFSDEDEVVWEDFDLCTVHEITLRYEGKRPTATVK